MQLRSWSARKLNISVHIKGLRDVLLVSFGMVLPSILAVISVLVGFVYLRRKCQRKSPSVIISKYRTTFRNMMYDVIVSIILIASCAI